MTNTVIKKGQPLLMKAKSDMVGVNSSRNVNIRLNRNTDKPPVMPGKPAISQFPIISEPIKIEGVPTSMLHALYVAKCKDLQISPNNREQELRFI